MLEARIRDAMNRLLAIHSRSFPQYLEYARPYAPGAAREKLDVVRQIVDDQQQMSDRIVSWLLDAEETPRLGKFPIGFTDTHDLCIDYLLKEAVQNQQRDIAAIEACVEAVQPSPAAAALAEEALGMAKAHLHLLEEALQDANDRPTVASSAG